MVRTYYLGVRTTNSSNGNFIHPTSGVRLRVSDRTLKQWGVGVQQQQTGTDMCLVLKPDTTIAAEVTSSA